MKEKVNQFKGIYTNASETNVPMNYCRETDAKVTTIGLEAKKTSIDMNSPIFNSEEDINYFGYITLDNDKNGTKIVDGEYKSNYTYEPVRYFCVVKATTLSLYQTTEKGEFIRVQYSSEVPNGSLHFAFEGIFRKALAFDNKFYLFTSEYSYELAKYNRITNRGYSENDILLKPFTYNQFINSDMELIADEEISGLIRKGISDNKLGLSLEFNRIGDETVVTNEIKYVVSEESPEFSIYVGGSFRKTKIRIINVIDTLTDTSIKEIWFISVNDIDKYDPLYWLAIPETSNGNWYRRLTKYEDGEYEGTNSSSAKWTALGFTNLSKSKEWTDGEIESLVNHTETYTHEFTIDEVNGFSSSDLYDTYYLASYLLDDGTEVPILEDKLESNTISNYYGYEIKVLFPYNLTTKVTAFRLYIRNKEEDQYEMLSHYSFYHSDPFKTILTKDDLSGIYLTQTIGTNDPSNEVILTTFDDAIYIEGMLLTMVGNNVYYPVIGNGYITKLFTLYNVIPNVYGSNLFNMNGSLAVTSSDRVQIVHISSQGGVLFFSLKDELGMIIKDRYDSVETPDGLILNTSKGIYSTDGHNLELLSEPINNIVIENYNNSDIFYDSLNKILWYNAHSIGKTYKFLFETGAWISGDYINARYLVTDIDNNKYALVDKTIYNIIETTTDVEYQSLLTNLGHMGIFKAITHIDFDFIGEIEWNSQKITSTVRNIDTIYRTIRQRYLVDFEEWNFKLSAGTILYGFEINFEVVKKRNQYTE